MLLFALVLFVPQVGRTLFGAAVRLLELVGIWPQLAGMGLSALRFWRQ
jgi:hypothetical protein